MNNATKVKPAARPYVSAMRAAAAAKRRQRVIESAMILLREEASIANFSLEAVAKAAGLTRLTVYNQFGSRRGLLEAVFDEIARAGGLGELHHAMALDDPTCGLDRVVEIFCAFWAQDLAVGKLHDAMIIDQEFSLALTARNERRRKLLRALVKRIPIPNPSSWRQSDVVDLLFAYTSNAMYRMLRAGRNADAVCALIKTACRAAFN